VLSSAAVSTVTAEGPHPFRSKSLPSMRSDDEPLLILLGRFRQAHPPRLGFPNPEGSRLGRGFGVLKYSQPCVASEGGPWGKRIFLRPFVYSSYSCFSKSLLRFPEREGRSQNSIGVFKELSASYLSCSISQRGTRRKYADKYSISSALRQKSGVIFRGLTFRLSKLIWNFLLSR